MRKVRFVNGLRLFQGEVEFKIVDTDAKVGIILEQVASGRRKCFEQKELIAELLSGRLVTRAMFEERNSEHACAPTDQLTEKQESEFRRRKSYVKALDRAARNSCVAKVINEVLEQIAGDIQDDNPPAPSTLRGWHTSWQQLDKADHSLIPKYNLRGRKKWAIDARAREIIDEELEQHFLQPKKKLGTALSLERFSLRLRPRMPALKRGNIFISPASRPYTETSSHSTPIPWPLEEKDVRPRMPASALSESLMKPKRRWKSSIWTASL